MENTIKEMVNYMVEEGCVQTTTSNWVFEIKELESKLNLKLELEGELENIIINYEDYKTGYTDTILQFIISNNIYYVATDTADEGLDIIIDYLENAGKSGNFINADDILIHEDDYIIDIEGNKYFSDEYIIGGNHGLVLYHGGNFRIEELSI